jgi:hypothetical protein
MSALAVLAQQADDAVFVIDRSAQALPISSLGDASLEHFPGTALSSKRPDWNPRARHRFLKISITINKPRPKVV